MTAAEFKKKWAKVSAKESAAYQSHFDDLCRLLGLPTPLEADPSGDEWFCFQKGVIKDAELVPFTDAAGAETKIEKGFADVWRNGCFGWEYKGRHKNLDDAHAQLCRYREALLNPPLLVVCDFDRFIVRTNFNGTAQTEHEFTNAQIDDPKTLSLLRSVFTDPDFLKPQRTTAEVTETLAAQIAGIAQSLQRRECRELADAKTRAELNFSQRKNLRIARFLNRIVFCFFAEDTGLLPQGLFSEVAKAGLDDPAHFAVALENLFAVMATGGAFGAHRIRHFNGHLFEESTVFELTAAELGELARAGEEHWRFIQPTIMGTLFERALDESQRSQLGAHYTSEADIKTLVEPVLMAPLRREWSALKGQLADACAKGTGTPSQRDRLASFQKKIAAITVLDPACGSGNFLYVSLQLLLDLEKEVLTSATQLGFKLAPQVSVQQLRAIELNPYAFELAQVSVQIGFLQWRRDNGFPNDRSPVLQNLDGFQNEDALLVPHFRSKAKTLKDAQAGEHTGDDALKFYTERKWPECDVIVGNPPFLGDKLMRRELSGHYVEELRRTYGNRIPGQSDLCCYWFEKARDLIENGKCKRAGLLATQGIRGGANREVLKRIKETGGIFFAESDRRWILAGANVHVSMVGFDDDSEQTRVLDGHVVDAINANLSAAADLTSAELQRCNCGLSFIGVSMHGPFDLAEAEALQLLGAGGNPTGYANADVVRPILNALEMTKRTERRWIIAFDPEDSIEKAALYERPFAKAAESVMPVRMQNNRAVYRQRWWIHGEPRPAMLAALRPLPRFIATPRVSKHRVFVWMTPERLPSDATVAFARDDDYFFGVMHSRIHEVWALAQGTQLREKESGFRYTPTTCFETFPFPFADDLLRPKDDPAQITAKFRAAHYHTDQSSVVREDPPPRTPDEHRAAIAAAAAELNALRERWLNPPEWTHTRTLEFPASADGPWARYVEAQTVDPKTRIGTVCYARTEPRDAESAAKLKKRTLTNLYNERPAWLALAHERLDATVAAAYGWPADSSDDQVLESLLALNFARAADEAKVATVKSPKTSREKHGDEML